MTEEQNPNELYAVPEDERLDEDPERDEEPEPADLSRAPEGSEEDVVFFDEDEEPPDPETGPDTSIDEDSEVEG